MLRVIRELCEALRESVDEGKRHGVSRFITDDLPESVIQGLRASKGDLPDLGRDLLVFVLDNNSQMRWTPKVSASWNFVTEDDLAAARTELADTSTAILVVLPPGRNLAATMDSTTRRIEGVFKSVTLSVGNFLGMKSSEFLHDLLSEIAHEEVAGDGVEMDSVRWGSLFDLDGLTGAEGFNDSVASRLGIMAGTTEGDWRRSKKVWIEVRDCVENSGIYQAVESWVRKVQAEEIGQGVDQALLDWRDHVVDRINGDSTLFVGRPWGVSRCAGETPSWYSVLNLERWSTLVDEREKEVVSEAYHLDWPEAVCQIDKAKTDKWQVYGENGLVFNRSLLSDAGEWLYGDDLVNTIERVDGFIQLQLPNSSVAKELRYRDVSTGQQSFSRNCVGLSDRFPCVIIMSNGVVKSWNEKKKVFKVKLGGVGKQRMSIVLHSGWSIVNEQVVGIGVRTDIEGDENEVVFEKSNGFERDGLRFQEFDFDTDEDSELKFSLLKEGLLFDVKVEVRAESSIASYEVESCWEKLVHLNLNTKRRDRKIPQVSGELTGMMELQLMLWKYSWGFPVIISNDTLRFRLKGDEEQWNGFKSQIFSSASLTGHMDGRGTQERFREDCRTLLEVRERIMHLLELGGNQKVVLEHRDLCQLDGFSELLEEYLAEYARLADESESDSWRKFETVWFHASEGHGNLIGKPSCMFLTPLHPLCLGWQYHTQLQLQETLNASNGCPQAALLSPVDLPPFWVLKDSKYLPIETNLAYWRCYSADQKQITEQAEVMEFLERDLEIKFKSMATGLKANQVESALDQVSKIFAAQTGFVISVSGERMHSDVNGGLENWLLANCSSQVIAGNGDSPDTGRPLHATIYDTRQLPSQHFGAGKLGLLVNDFGVELSYHTAGDKSHEMVDIAFLTSLKTSDPVLRDKSGEYCVDPVCLEGGLMRFGLSSLVHGESVENSLDLKFAFDAHEDGLGGPLSWCLRAVQDSLSDGVPKSYLFAPEPELMRELLGKSEFLAVSSPLLDLDYLTGQDDMLVWQYAIPAYGESAGTNDGYFLISKTKEEYVKSLEAKLRAAGIELSQANAICRRLVSIAGKRGVLDLKRFLSGGAASVGEIGMLGAQLMLDPGAYYDTWPGLLGARTKEDFSLLVPVDPFEKRLNVLREAIGYKGHSRPDYFVLRFTETEMFVSLVEVKWRSNSMSDSELKAVVKNQIHGFMGFLETLQEWQEKGGLWRRAFRVLLAEVTLFGLRLSMADRLIDTEVARSCMHTLGEVFANRKPIVLDPRKGRVIAFAREGANQFSDLDKDGFPEILLVSLDQVVNLFDPTRVSQFTQAIGAGPKDWFEVPQSSGKVLTLENEEVHPVAAEPDQDLINSEWGEDAEDSADTGSGIREENSLVVNDHETQPMPQNSDLSKEEVATDGEGICFAVGGASGVMGEMSYDYAPSNTALTQLNMGVVGDLGTGKTQLLKALMYQIARDPSRNRGVAPKFLVLDTKRDYGGNEGINGVMHDALGIKVIRPFNMPLNIFDIRGSKEFHPMMAKANFFVDILDKIHSGMGPIQRTNLFEAIQSAFEEKGYEPGMDFSNFEAPTLKDVFEAYAANGQKDSPYSIMYQLLMNKLFVEDASQAQSFSEFFSSSVVVSLGDIASMDKPLRLALVIFLNLYRDYMLNVEKRKYIGSDPQLRFVDSYVLIDEAKLIMDLDLQVLEDLLRKGREFGVGVVLSSQYPGDFKSKSMNYGEALATWFIHKVPKVTEKELEQLGFQNVAGLPQKIKALEPHHCLYKSFGCNGEVIHATPYYKIVQGEGA